MAADRRRRTPWFPRSISPVHRGTYECAAQITNAGPAFLWELEWDGKGFLVPIPMIVKRWRGLVKRTAGVPEVHARLAQAKKLHGLGPFVDAVLAECPDAVALNFLCATSGLSADAYEAGVGALGVKGTPE